MSVFPGISILENLQNADFNSLAQNAKVDINLTGIPHARGRIIGIAIISKDGKDMDCHFHTKDTFADNTFIEAVKMTTATQVAAAGVYFLSAGLIDVGYEDQDARVGGGSSGETTIGPEIHLRVINRGTALNAAATVDVRLIFSPTIPSD